MLPIGEELYTAKESWYSGVVYAFDITKKLYLLKYDDDDIRAYFINAEMVLRLLDLKIIHSTKQGADKH